MIYCNLSVIQEFSIGDEWQWIYFGLQGRVDVKFLNEVKNLIHIITENRNRCTSAYIKQSSLTSSAKPLTSFRDVKIMSRGSIKRRFSGKSIITPSLALVVLFTHYHRFHYIHCVVAKKSNYITSLHLKLFQASKFDEFTYMI